jgi:hypothetical protein
MFSRLLRSSFIIHRSSFRAWLIPIVATILLVAFGVFIRAMVGRSDKQQMYYGTRPFVPGESPYSTGPDSR